MAPPSSTSKEVCRLGSRGVDPGSYAKVAQNGSQDRLGTGSRETKSGLRGQGLTQAPGSAQPVKIQRHRTVGATDSVAVSRQEWVQMDSGDFKKTAIARH